MEQLSTVKVSRKAGWVWKCRHSMLGENFENFNVYIFDKTESFEDEKEGGQDIKLKALNLIQNEEISGCGRDFCFLLFPLLPYIAMVLLISPPEKKRSWEKNESAWRETQRSYLLIRSQDVKPFFFLLLSHFDFQLCSSSSSCSRLMGAADFFFYHCSHGIF